MAYRNILLLFVSLSMFSCASRVRYMHYQDNVLSPTSNSALVRFISPEAGCFIFDSDKLIAYMDHKTQFSYLAEPGKHLFITSAENRAFLEADLEAGKKYYILVRSYTGIWQERVAFVAVNRASEYWDQVSLYENEFRNLVPEMEEIRQWEEANRHRLKENISQYEATVKNNVRWPRLNPEDGR